MTKLLITIVALMCTSCSSLEIQDRPLTPYLVILGTAQDAGYPQAGCFAKHCLPGWKGKRDKALPVSLGLVDPASGAQHLFEATPSIGQQLYDLNTTSGSDQLRLDGIFLTHAHMGHYTGLMHLGREAMGAGKVPVHAMPRMTEFLTTNGPWSQLVSLGNIALVPLAADVAVEAGRVSVTPVLVPHRDEYSETVGYRIQGPNKTALFIPDIDKWSKWERSISAEVEAVDYAFIDATFFDGDELPGRNMSEIPHPFVVESMQRLSALNTQQRSKVWFIHFNHSNPLLEKTSNATRRVRDAGFAIARRGMKFEL